MTVGDNEPRDGVKGSPDPAVISGLSGDTLAGLLAAAAARDPEAIALAAPGREPLAYGALQRHVEGMVTALAALGVGRGDRVAIVLPGGPELASAFLAVASAAVAALLNPAYVADELDFYLRALRVTALLVQKGVPSPARDVARAQGIPVIELVPGERAGLFTLEGVEVAPLPPRAAPP